MEGGLTSPLFWGSLVVALAIAFVVTVPVNLWLMGRGEGHAVVHQFHGGAPADGPQDASTPPTAATRGTTSTSAPTGDTPCGDLP